MNPDEYCQNKTLESGSSFYYSFLFLSEQQRKAITALYAFCREVDDIVDTVNEPSVAQSRLEWWREELGKTYQGQASHPISQALALAIKQYDLPQKYFLEIVDGMAMDLEQFSYPSFNQLELYCHRVAGVVGLLSIQIFGYQSRETIRYAETLGMALQLTNIIRDIREDAERGRIYLPQDELVEFDVKTDDILSFKTTPELIQLLEFQAKRAREYYQQALTLLPDCDRYAQRTGLIMAAIYQTTLDEIAEDGFRVMEHRVSLTPLRKLWIAWRTANKAKQYKVAA